MTKKQLIKLAKIYADWNEGKLPGNDAMVEVGKIFPSIKNPSRWATEVKQCS